MGNPDGDNTFVCDKNTAAYKLLTKSRTVTIVVDDHNIQHCPDQGIQTITGLMHSICKYPKCPFTAVLQFQSNFGPALVSLKADGGNRVGWSNQREMQKVLTTQKHRKLPFTNYRENQEKDLIICIQILWISV